MSSFKVTCPCQSCHQRFAYERVIGDTRQPLCPHCDYEQVPMTDVSGFDPMSFLRCGNKFEFSPWESIKHREKN